MEREEYELYLNYYYNQKKHWTQICTNLFRSLSAKYIRTCGVSVPKFVKIHQVSNSTKKLNDLKWFVSFGTFYVLFLSFSCYHFLPKYFIILYGVFTMTIDRLEWWFGCFLFLCLFWFFGLFLFCLYFGIFWVMVVDWIRLPSFLFVASLTLTAMCIRFRRKQKTSHIHELIIRDLNIYIILFWL